MTLHAKSSSGTRQTIELIKIACPRKLPTSRSRRAGIISHAARNQHSRTRDHYRMNMPAQYTGVKRGHGTRNTLV